MSLPPPALNPDSRAFWEAARDSRLLIKKCDACARVFFPPRHLCPFCWSEKTSWIESGGAGTVYSFTVIHRAPAPEFAGRGPYVVALISLAEGPRIMANIIGENAFDTAVGDQVNLCFEARDEGWKVPQFKRIPSISKEG
jgi:uncharacterized OB-fold protein